MAFTTPRTWTDGELVNASIMNGHIRDNFNAMGPHLLVRKTADESVTSSTVLQDDDSLLFAIPANETWEFTMTMLWTAPVGFDMKWTFTWPGTGVVTTSWPLAGGTNPVIQTVNVSGTESDLDAIISTLQMTTFHGSVANGGSPGTFQFRWAQDTSSATPAVVKANSTLWGVKLA